MPPRPVRGDRARAVASADPAIPRAAPNFRDQMSVRRRARQRRRRGGALVTGRGLVQSDSQQFRVAWRFALFSVAFGANDGRASRPGDIGGSAAARIRYSPPIASFEVTPLPLQLSFALSGFIVGLLIGQTGMGGGALMTPLLVLFFGVHPATAVGTDLLYASATKTAGTLVHGLNHTVDWRIVARLASGSVPATALTLFAISRFHLAGGGHMISLVLGVMLILTASSLVFRRWVLAFARPALTQVSPAWSGRMTVLTGVLLGVLVTISSVGAGALGVTALMLLYPSERMAVIVGSDIAHAVPLTLVAGVGHWWLGSVDWALLASLLTGSIPGIVLGSYLSAHVPDRVLRPILAVTLLLVGGRLVF
jgi:uncharacterized protein